MVDVDEDLGRDVGGAATTRSHSAWAWIHMSDKATHVFAAGKKSSGTSDFAPAATNHGRTQYGGGVQIMCPYQHPRPVYVCALHLQG